MITTVCLNPSIDHTLRVEAFTYGALNRVAGSRYDAGGKGLNVAVAVSALGADAECVGFMYKESARLFETRLLKSGTAYDFVWRDGSARTNLKVFDAARHVVTEFNEPGCPVGALDLERMTQLIIHRAERADCLILSGSMPPGCPEDYYAHLLRAVSGCRCRCILDADGAALRYGIASRPYLIKPNRAELEGLSGRALDTPEAVRDAAREILAHGVRVVAVSLGGDGAVVVDEGNAYFAPGLDVKVRSTVGAGDSMVAGFAAGMVAGADLETMFRMGVACASAMCMTEGSQTFARSDYQALLDTVRVERI